MVKDLSEETVVLLAPKEQTELSTGTVVFSWETVEDATHYQLQVASPNFESARQGVIDTLVSSRNFSFDLTPEVYQWRLRALNSAYETPYVGHRFRVVSQELVVD